jgi:membrane-bound metal-dependent hydrolase YbcI (DUF457 family)
MNRPSHILYGGCLAVAFIATTGDTISIGPVEAFTYVAAPFAIFGSYLPDIDVKNSNMRKRWQRISKRLALATLPVMVLLVLEMMGIFSLGLFGSFLTVILPVICVVYFNLLVSIQLKHRTYTHSYYMPFMFAFVMWAIATHLGGALAISLNSIVLGVGIGFTAHLVSDSFTKSGTYLAYPLPIKVRFLPKFMAVTTGSWNEKLFSLIVIGITAVYCFFQITGV